MKNSRALCAEKQYIAVLIYRYCVQAHVLSEALAEPKDNTFSYLSQAPRA